MKLKPGASLDGITAKTLHAMAKAEEVAVRHWHELVVTSGTDGTHMAGSLHYLGLAFDMRHWWWDDAERKTIRDELAEALGADYDVVLESSHFHIEYDPD